MGASASEIASARALASSRGYDPNLVDADNADRANSAFPVQSGGGGGSKSSSGGGGSSSTPAAPAPVAGLQSSAPTPAPATPGAGAGPASDAIGGLQGAAPMSSLGGGGADQDMGMSRAALKPTLGSRIPPQENLILASLRRAY